MEDVQNTVFNQVVVDGIAGHESVMDKAVGDGISCDMSDTRHIEQLPETTPLPQQPSVGQLDRPPPSNTVTAGAAEVVAEDEFEPRTTATTANGVMTEEAMQYSSCSNVNLELQSEGNIVSMDNNIMFWEDGIGCLAGSDLKFRVNELGLIEILDDEAWQRLCDQASLNNTKENNDNNLQAQATVTNGTHDDETNTAVPLEEMMEVDLPEQDSKVILALNNVQVPAVGKCDTLEQDPTASSETTPIVPEPDSVGATSDSTAIRGVKTEDGATSLNPHAACGALTVANGEPVKSAEKEVQLKTNLDSSTAEVPNSLWCGEEPLWAEMETQQINPNETEASFHGNSENAQFNTAASTTGLNFSGTTAIKVENKCVESDVKITLVDTSGANRNVGLIENTIAEIGSADVKPKVEAPAKSEVFACNGVVGKSDPSSCGPVIKSDSLADENVDTKPKLEAEKIDRKKVLIETIEKHSQVIPLEEGERSRSQNRSVSVSSEEDLPDIDRQAPPTLRERSHSRSLSPVFHLPPPPLANSCATGNLDGIPTLKPQTLLLQDKDLVFCKCCGCFGLQQEFYQSIFCTKACGDSYVNQTRSSDGRFRKPMPVTPKRCKILAGHVVSVSDQNVESKSPGERNSVSPSDKGKKKKQKSPPVSKAKIKSVAALKGKTKPGEDTTVTANSKLKNQKRLSTTKSTAFHSKDRKRNFPLVLSKRMPTSPERKILPDSITKEVQLSPDITHLSRMRHTPLKSAAGPSEFAWKKYLADTNSKSVPHRLFRQPAMPPENPFKPGWMLESIDSQHQSLICVTTVVETQGYRVRLRFQGFSEAYDYWVNADSLDIFPAGWCEENGLELQPPPGAPEPFNWHQYLVKNELEAAPRHIFAITKEDFTVDSGVRPGMKLEAVDIRNQNLVCVATVAKVMGERILVHFDSWDSLYDYWTDLTSPYIHPVGWCEKNNVKLTPPNYIKTAFSWDRYLQETNTIPMPARLFRPLPPVGFRKGFKVECVDKRNPFLVRVATIAEVDKHNLVIHFDNWPAIYDYSVYELSPDIHPIGWCAHTGHPLQPPPPADGTWKGPCTIFGCLGLGHIRGPKFLTHNSEKNCPYAPHNYKKDWILADRVLLFERNFGQGHNDNSSNVELVKQADSKVAHIAGIQSKSSSRVSQMNGTKSSGTPKSATVKRKRSSTSSSKDYNQQKPSNQPLSSSSRTPSPTSAALMQDSAEISEVGMKTEGKEIQASILESIPTITKRTGTSHEEHGAEPTVDSASLVQKSTQSEKKQSPKSSITKKVCQSKDPGPDAVSKSTPLVPPMSLATFPPVGRNTEGEADFPLHYGPNVVTLKSAVGTLTEGTVSGWKVEELARFIAKIPGCESSSNRFLDQVAEFSIVLRMFLALCIFVSLDESLIDGESFLMLSQADFINVMGLKLGPAIKLCHVIRLINFNTVSNNFKRS